MEKYFNKEFSEEDDEEIKQVKHENEREEEKNSQVEENEGESEGESESEGEGESEEDCVRCAKNKGIEIYKGYWLCDECIKYKKNKQLRQKGHGKNIENNKKEENFRQKRSKESNNFINLIIYKGSTKKEKQGS